MGDISTEPSMEEILSSIKRIIAEEGDAAASSRARRSMRPVSTASAPKPDPVDLDEEVLELSEPVTERVAPQEPQAASPVPMPIGAPDVPREPAAQPAPQAKPDSILSDSAAEATRGRLEALSRMMIKPEVSGSDTLEGLVREMLKPMLSEWLDANLPQIVETMVAREISRITGRQG